MRGFDRLIMKMDEIAGEIDEEVIMQIGYTRYKPNNAEFFDFSPIDRMKELNKDARIIVCHAGTGSILMALEYNKQVIVIPRLSKFGEHIDDHQLDIAREFEKEGLIIVVNDMDILKKSLNSSRDIKFRSENILVKKLKEYMFELKN